MSLEIKCPKCGEQIKIGKDEYNTLLNEIEKSEINNQVNARVEEIKKSLEAKSELELNKIQTQQNQRINDLETQNKVLQEQLNNKDKDSALAVAKATEAIKEDLSKKNEEITKLNGDIEILRNSSELEIKNLKSGYETLLKQKEEDIQRWKDLRLGASTKALGESLEQYCHDKFEEIRSYAFPNATFKKDNFVDEDGKGDFIFKDYQDGIETVSIMFEMKNQNDTTKTKHKNEDFFDKLDKNRTSKKCEYAVLVSMLEENSDLYNTGIVDVSHKYPKMFVIRPQFFIPIIGLISNMAKNSFEYKKQVITYQRENVDITNFESTVEAIMQKINSDYEKAGAVYSDVDKMCDAIIKEAENFRKKFKIATGWIEKAKNQLPNLEIRKLTYGNPTMKEKFDTLKKSDTDQ